MSSVLEEGASNSGVPTISMSMSHKRKSDTLLEEETEIPICRWCGEEGCEVRHVHTSSEGNRGISLERGQNKVFCIMCKEEENNDLPPTTRKLLVSDSTIYDVWNKDDVKVENCHIDIEAIKKCQS